MGWSSGFSSGFGVSVGSLARRHRLRWELFEVSRQPARRTPYLAPLTLAVRAQEPEKEVVRGGGGVPALPRMRRLRPVELEGYGEISIVGTGDLAVERAIAGVIPIILIASANLEVDLTDEALALALLGIPPDSERGLALWALLN